MLSSSSVVLTIPTTTSPVRVARLRKLPASVDQATMTLAGSSAALPVSARYSDFVRAPMGPIERSSGHGAWKAEVSAALDVGESWNLGVFLAHALKAHGRLQEQQSDAPGDAPRAVWATGAVDVIDLRLLPVGHIETKLRQALGATPVPDLFLLPPDNLGDVPTELRAELEARGTRIIAPATMAEALEALDLPPDWAKEAAPDLAGWRGDPYRGLEAYQAEHRPIFFGRASARTEALERLRTRAERGTSLLVIHGKSGVGKSSLAMAGLLDDVVEQVPGRAPFGTATIRFGDGATPLAALRAGFAQALELEEASALQSSSAAEWLKTWPMNTEPSTLLLILDQLEQALLADEADTIAFGEAIAMLVQTGRVWVITTLRSDRIDLLERAPALAEMADGDALYRLVRPTLAELGEIIRAPAKLAGIAFEEGIGTDLVNRLAEEAMRAPDSLPLLQVTLMRLAAQRDADGRVGMRDYERIGGFSGAVGRLADETVRKMEAEGIDGNVVDQTLASLVRIDPDTDRVDARVVDPDAQTAEVQQVLSALVEARLATASTVSEALDPDADGGSDDRTGPNDSGRRVRLAHETLIREWPRLHDLAGRLRSELGLRDRLEDEALRWEQDGRPKGDLIRNTARLTAAEALVADGLATPSPQAQTYVEASRAEVERQAEQRRAAAALEQRTRTRRRITTAAAVVTVVILGMAGFATNQTQQTRAAEALAAAQLEATRQAEQAAAQAETAAALQTSLAEEQTLRREAAEQAAEQARELTQDAFEAQRRAEEQLEQATINQIQFLLETVRSLTQEDPSLAFHRLAEIPITPEQLLDLDLYDEFLAMAVAVSIQDRELMRFVVPERAIGLSPDGTLIVTVPEEENTSILGHILRIRNAITGETIFTLRGHRNYIYSAVFSSDGARLVTASHDGTARIWDVNTGEALFVLNGHEARVNSAAFSSDGNQIVTASTDGTARIWDADTGEALLVLRGHENNVFSAVFSPAGTRVATGSQDGSARIWNATSGALINTLNGHESSVFSVAFSSDGTRLVTGSSDDTARIWDVATGEAVVRLHGHRAPVSSAVFSPGDTRVVTGSWDNTARVWEVATGTTTIRLRGPESTIGSVAFWPDGTRVTTAYWDGSMRIWDVAAGEALITLRGHEGPVMSASFAPDGTRVVTGSWDNTARVWDVATRTEILTLGHGGGLLSAEFSPDGTRIVTGSLEWVARIWDVTSGEILVMLQGHRDSVGSAAFSPDDTLVATGSRDGTARIWDARTGTEIRTLQGHGAPVIALTFSPDGTQIVTGSSDNTARIWDTRTGTEIRTLRGHAAPVTALTFSPDGTQIVTGSSDNTARIWDAATGAEIRILRGHGGILNAAFSPDGTRIVTGSMEGDARVWDAGTGEILATLPGHRLGVHAEFSPDGTQIVTGTGGGITQVWGFNRPSNRQHYPLIQLGSFERLSERQSHQSLFAPAEALDPMLTANISAARAEFARADWQIEPLNMPDTVQVLASWRAAAARGVPEAHQALSTALLSDLEGSEQDLETALLHAAIATRIYEALDDEEAAAPMRIRRANLARTLPPETVAALWPQIRDWRPRFEE